MAHHLGWPCLAIQASKTPSLRIRSDPIILCSLRSSPLPCSSCSVVTATCPSMAWIARQGQPRWCAICPPSLRGNVVWKTHTQTHSGVARTTSRIQLTWYWPGMTAMIRRTVRSCEICQAAKHGGMKGPQGRQRLHAGRPWQKLAVDLVGPMPETSRGNKWILVLVDHFTH